MATIEEVKQWCDESEESSLPISKNQIDAFEIIRDLKRKDKYYDGEQAERIIDSAGYDIIYLGDPFEKMEKEDFINLVKCGVHFDHDTQTLAMFV